MTDRHQESIEKYLLGQMDTTEKAAFEDRLKSDMELQKEWQAYHLAITSLKVADSEMVRNRLAAIESQIRSKEGRRKGMWFLLALILLVVVFFAVMKYNSGKTFEKKIPDQPIIAEPGEKGMPNPDSMAKGAAGNEWAGDQKGTTGFDQMDEDKTVVNQTEQQLFAANFKPYMDEAIGVMSRGSNSGYFERYTASYVKGDFAGTLMLYDSLNASMRQNENILFLQSNALLARGRIEEAQLLLLPILERKKSRYALQSQWYMALIHLKKKQIKEARVLLKDMAKDPNHPFHAKAITLLRSMEKLR
ncbi:MAG: hypothetical protein IPN73_19335 [Saprospiraceae bacterium]|nr:hypothetical protein [Saprospiraceae bacterium]